MTRAEWDVKCKALISDLLRDHVESGRAIRLANEAMVKRYGKRPPKPQREAGADSAGKVSKLAVLLSLARLALSGGHVDFSFLTALWKGVRTALLATLAAGLPALVDAFFSNFNSVGSFEVLGVPAWIAAGLLLLFEAARNAIKFFLAKMPKKA